MKWKEQYVSEGLNRKVAPTQPAGIYQGLRMIENIGSPRQVELSPDPDTGYHMAVYQSTTGYSLTYWDLAGTAIILDLSDGDLDSTDVVIGIEMDYTIGVDTVAEWKAFPVADWNALPLARKNEIIVLGTVAVPAPSTNITTAMISFERTTMAWRNISKGAIAWSQLLRNGDFEQASSDNAWYWAMATQAGSGTGTVLTTTTDPSRNNRALTLATLTTGSVTYQADQNIGVPVTPGQLGMIRFQKKNLITSDAGTLNLSLLFADDIGMVAGGFATTIDTSVIDGSYEEVLSLFEVPAGSYTLVSISLFGTMTYSTAPVDVLYIDDIGVWIETEGERNDLQHGVSGNLEVMGRLSMRDPAATYGVSSLAMDYSSNRLTVDDHASSGLVEVDINGTLRAGANTIDTAVKADVARVTAPASVAGGVEYTLMWESIPSGEKGYRKYVSPIGALVETINATYNNTTNNWTKDVNGETAVRMTIGSVASVGMVVEYQEAGTNTWADGMWTSNVMSVDNTAFNALVAASGVLTSTTVIDQINELRDGKHGSKFLYLPAGLALTDGANDDTLGPSFFGAKSALFGHGWRPDATATTDVELPFPMHSGDRIIQLKYYLRESAVASDIEVGMHIIDPLGGSDGSIGGTKKSSTTNTEAQIIFDFATDGPPWPYTLLADRLYGATIEFDNTASLASFIGLRIEYDHP
jgi:hypothetical protein